MTSTRDRGEPPLLELRGIEKRYGGVHALRGADLTIGRPGLVLGLIGQNGCGKSTLLGVLSGQQRPDAGEVLLDGEAVEIGSPSEAIARGIVMVSQETALAPQLTVAENVLMGRRLARGPFGIDWQRTERVAAEILAGLGVDFDPAALVGTLSPDRQQMVEVARALSMDARILILDEPTSSLGRREVEGLFAAVRAVTAQGVSVIFVSHRMPEMFEIADEITVLREGRTVATGPASAFTAETLVDAMVGHPVDAVAAEALPRPAAAATGHHALEVRDLTLTGVFEGISLQVAPGQIVGLAGLTGSGRSELLETLFGVGQADSGTILLDGEPYTPRDPRTAIASGIGYLPPDRKTQGLVLKRSIGDNMAMAATMTMPRLRSPRVARVRALVEEAMAAMQVKADGPDVPVSTLSGGGQQKVALGKWTVAGSTVLLLDEPTRGVDVSAKREIYTLLKAAAATGTTILVSSSENPELLELCDRIVVLASGRVVADLDASTTDEFQLGLYTGGALYDRED
ncbi:MAG: sugar ABC transporter ATP-binding protein [Leucobacter sp.]